MSHVTHQIGSIATATAVDLHAAGCAIDHKLFDSWQRGANLNMASQVKITQQIAVSAYLKTSSERLDFGGCSTFTMIKSLDYATNVWLGLCVEPMKLALDKSINCLATLAFDINWLAKLIRCVRLRVQDLLITEVDHMGTQIHNHAFVHGSHRSRTDLLMGNTPAFLTPRGWGTEDFECVGVAQEVYFRLPIFAVLSGHHSTPLITGAALFNDIYVEVELNNVSDIMVIRNGPCGTPALDGSAEGRSAVPSDIVNCNGTFPSVLRSFLMVDGAIDTDAGKTGLSEMSAKTCIHTLGVTRKVPMAPYGDTTLELRNHNASTAVYAGVQNVTYGRNSCDLAAHEGGPSPWSQISMYYESSRRHTTTPGLSLKDGISFGGEADGGHLSYIGYFPHSFDSSSHQHTGSTQFGRISDVTLTFHASPELSRAAEGFANGMPIEATSGNSEFCGDSGQDATAPGVKQRHVAFAIPRHILLLHHERSSLHQLS